MLARRGRGNRKGGARRNEANKNYADPLPVLLDIERAQSSYASRCTTSFLGLFGLTMIHIKTPYIEGTLNMPTKSVWITNSADAMVLWRRGFFGKGSLSRSEPSWLARQINQRTAKATGSMYLLMTSCSLNLLTRIISHVRYDRRRGYC